MADIRWYQQVDQDRGEIAINLDQVVMVERQLDRGFLSESPTQNLSAVFVTTAGDRIQVLIKSVFEDGGHNDSELDGAFEKFIQDLKNAETVSGRRSRFGS